MRPAEWYKAFAYVGMRFASAPGQSVEVVRVGANMFRRPNLIISPDEREEFLEAARRAMGR